MKNTSLSTNFVRGTLATAALLVFPSFASAANLVAQWDMNEGTGTTLTAEIGTYSGAETTSEDFSTTTGLSWGGSASDAPGSTNYLNFDDQTNALNTLNTNVSGVPLAGTGGKTFVAWVKLGVDPSPPGWGYQIMSYTPTGGAGAGKDLRFSFDLNGKLRSELSGGYFENNDIDFRDNVWHMVAVIFDGNANTSSFYADGAMLPPTFAPNLVIDTSGVLESLGSNENLNIVIGNNHAGNAPFFGGIDMVKIYDDALDETELNNIFTGGVIPEPSALLLLGMGAIGLLAWRRNRR